jgi:hypothetical protein
MANIPTPRLKIWFTEDDDEPTVVQTVNSDLVLMETTARKHNWGSMQDAPIKVGTFLAYAALKRKGLLNGETFEQFDPAAVTALDDTPAAVAVPTQPDPGSG